MQTFSITRMSEHQCMQLVPVCEILPIAIAIIRAKVVVKPSSVHDRGKLSKTYLS